MFDGPALPRRGTMLDMDCRCCGSRQVELVLDLGDQPHCNRLVTPGSPASADPRFPLRLGFCRECTMVQIDHTIPKEAMFSDYPYVSGTTRTLRAHFAGTSERLVKTYGLGKRDLVVDIGSNDGTWLAQYAPFGCRVLGVEAAANVAALAASTGVLTWNRFFDQACARAIRAEMGPARLVTAAGVFFHLEDLHDVTAGISELLDDDGIFVVQAIYLGGMLEKTAFDQIYHEHLCYYTLGSLSELLARHGLEVFDARLIPIHGGSLEAHVTRRGRRPVQPGVARLAEAEARQGLDEIAPYQSFAGNVLGLRDHLLQVLHQLRAQGRSVWAYGAPAKGATLLNSFGIGTDLVQLAVERNPLKIGMAMPGCRIPIVPEDSDRRPDAYLVLSWNFLEEFLQSRANQDFLRAGGSFIVPVPRVHLIDANGRRDA